MDSLLISFFGPPNLCSQISSPDLFPWFLWEKVPEKSSRKILGKILKTLRNKNSRHMSVDRLGPPQKSLGAHKKIFLFWWFSLLFTAKQGKKNRETVWGGAKEQTFASMARRGRKSSHGSRERKVSCVAANC